MSSATRRDGLGGRFGTTKSVADPPEGVVVEDEMGVFRKILTVGLVSLASCSLAWGAQPLSTLEAAPVATRGGDAEFAVVPQGPGWLHLPEMNVSLDPVPPGGAVVWVQGPPPGDWVPMTLSDGTARLPIKVGTVSDLWALRFRIDGAPGSTLRVTPRASIVLTDLEFGEGVPSALTLTNWGDPTRLRIKAVDLAGRAVALQTADVALTCSPEGEWYDLGMLSAATERDVIVAAGQEVRYPVTVTVENESGTPTYAVLKGAPEAAPVGQVNYYGVTPTQQWNCQTGNLIANATQLVITAIVAPVTYTLYNLTDGTVFASDTLSAKGAQATITGLTDNKSWKLATSLPVQAYMGYDCSGTLPGSMFFLADDGLLNYGTAFTVPFANWEATTPYRLQYWVFATGAGTVSVKTLAGATMLTNTFSAAGGWQIPLGTLSRNTVYLISFAPSASGAVIAVQQSSQNAATDVPAITQVADACTVTNVGRTFYVDVQQWTGDGRIVAFAYEGSGAGTITATNLATSAVTTITTTASTGNAYESPIIATGAYRIDSTVNIGVIAGSPEGGTAIYDLGDDAFYYHGDGTSVRGAAMRCGGKVFVAQDGTNITAACTPGSPCGLPAISNPYSADSVLTITGNTANANIFDFTTQDTQHTLLVEVIGGNCATQLNDWSKIMQPAALGRPVITYPLAGSPLLTTTPTVVGTGFPGATVSMYIAPPPPGTPGTQVLFGTALVDAAGNWSMAYPGSFAPLTPGTTYSFDAVQSVNGACSTVSGAPPVGSSGSSGVINVTPPTVATPANGAVVSTLTPTLSGTAPAGTAVTLTITGPGGPYTVTTTADGSGNYSVASPTLPVGGPFSVSAVARDGAGNVSPPSNTNSFTVIAAGQYITKTSSANGGYVGPGQTLTYTITVANSTASTWTGVTVGDPLPANTAYVAGSSQVTKTTPQTGTYYDQFSAIAYNGSNGTIAWAGTPWVEINDDGSVTNGNVRVDNRYGTNSLRINSRGGSLVGAYRPANLSSGVSATITLDYLRRDAIAGQHWYLDISKDSGATYPTRLWTLSSGTADTAFSSVGPFSIPSDYLNANFRFRIVADGTAANDTRGYFDNVRITLNTLTATSAAGGAPPTLVSGYTLNPGEYLTITFQATINAGLANTVANIANTATLTATGLSGGPYSATVTDVILPAPVVDSPVVAGATSVSGTSTAPSGSTVTVYNNGVSIGTATVQPGGTWTLSGIGALAGGESITATGSFGGATSAASDAVIVQCQPPVVDSPINAGASNISGTSSSPVGTTITVYSNGVSIGTTTVQAGGTWTLTGVSGLAGGESITATAGTGAAQSAVSNTVVVTPAAPVVNSPIIAGSTSVSGTSTAPPGSTITVYVDGTPHTVGVNPDGTWTVSVPALAAGATVSATVTAGGQTSGVSNVVTVQNYPPTVSSPINAGASAIGGTCGADVGTTITVYSNGTPIGTTTIQPGHTWVLTGVSGLLGGEPITATAGTGAAQSAVSNTVVVTPAAPTITTPLLEGATSVSGTSAAPVGSTITVIIGGNTYTSTVQPGDTWSVSVPALSAGDQVQAAVTAGGQTSTASTTTVACAPPVVSSPIYAGAPSISGTSPSPAGTTITVYNNGVSIGTTTVQAGGTWTLTGVSGLLGGESITATAGTGASQSAVSNTVVVTPAPPTITSPVLAGATSVSGTSSAPDGSTVSVYDGATLIGTAAVTGGIWTLSSIGPLADGHTLTATVTAPTGGTSATSAPVVVSADAADVTPPPTVTSPLNAGATSVSGTSTSPSGTIIDVFVDGIFVGTTTVQADHTWTLTGIAALTDGQPVTATATDSAGGHGTSAPSAPVVVSANAGDQTPAPTVLGPIYDGATQVFGTSTSPAGTRIDVFADGVFIGTTTVQTGGAWNLSGINPYLVNLQSITATATDSANGHGTSAPSAAVIVEPSGSGSPTPAPTVTSPISAGDTSVSGASSSPDGTTIDVFVNGVFVGTTTVSGGTWTLSGIAALTEGQQVTATATDSANGYTTSGPSAPVTVSGGGGITSAPSVTGPIYAGAGSVSGTSSSPDGTRIDVYENGVFLGTTTVASGAWTLSGLSGSTLVAGQVVTATATETGKGTSAPSSGVTVQALPPSTPPIVTASLLAGASQTITGSSVEAAGSTITVYVNGLAVGTTTVAADGSWSYGPVALSTGDLVKATVQASGKAVSAFGNTVVVSNGTGGVTAPPVITPGLSAGATSVSGTSTTPGATVDVYADGLYLGSVVADGSGNWTLSSLGTPLAGGAILTATATLPGSGTSDWGAPVVVGSILDMLRSDAMTTLTPPPASLFTHKPQQLPYPSLETLGPNHRANTGEQGVTSDPSQPVAPGTADDDRFYLANVTTGSTDPDPKVLDPADGRKLIFYELLDNGTKTLKLSKSGGNIVFTITP